MRIESKQAVDAALVCLTGLNPPMAPRPVQLAAAR
ncbi:hypothetical protein BP1258A_1321 [Burkholderia pseudomallei 1258a]|nr:hypothetical protein BP1026B_I1647 [Burkholderia pseudomallei 1026b]EIF65957.1 hypothetical protein BP1258A_1321 [Burkholderia pseudomallei 1258a]EIF66449.1 hypothetical protein BP1026A_0779 [Burkholderia pseudomallei 1026a]EIF67979.1 hypothetical protein BP1258B_1414 [Burkholderia pseudomallei 1258b]EIF76962.1 hypothetical protein BP354E_1199 [Burkholderia pseudomallei 354e]EIF81224.1 hypothetical protein BP354A_1575 [Burkholderia pseudomallei 354a]